MRMTISRIFLVKPLNSLPLKKNIFRVSIKLYKIASVLRRISLDECRFLSEYRETFEKSCFAKKVVSFKKLRSIDIDSFCENIKNSPLLQQQAPDLETLVNQYDNVLKSLLDKHAPVMQRRVTIRPSAPWYTQEVALAKNKRRRLERKWYSTRLQSDRELYVYQCSVANNLITSLKSDYYTSIINEHAADQRVLFKTVNKLLQQSTEKHYPLSPDNVTLANSFADFFMNKIDKIHCVLNERQATIGSSPTVSNVCTSEFREFIEVSQDDVKEYVSKPSRKSCDLDPLPARVFKICSNLLLPAITKISIFLCQLV